MTDQIREPGNFIRDRNEINGLSYALIVRILSSLSLAPGQKCG